MIRSVVGALSVRPMSAGEMGTPPDDLTDISRAKWDEMCVVWDGYLAVSDRDRLASYCRLEDTRAEAEAKLREFGRVVASPSGMPVASPWLAIASKADDSMAKIAAAICKTSARKKNQTAAAGLRRSVRPQSGS